MSTHYRHINDSKGFRIRYEFDQVGDGLPRHVHAGWDDHMLEVVKGTIALVYCGEHPHLIPAGKIHGVANHLPHEVLAMADGTVVDSWFLNGQPASYKALPAHELEGQFERHIIAAKNRPAVPSGS